MFDLTLKRASALLALTLSLSLAGCQMLAPRATPNIAPTARASLQPTEETRPLNTILDTLVAATPIVSSPTLPPPSATPTETPPPAQGLDSIGDPYAPHLGNTGYDVQAYNLELNLDPAFAFVEGRTTLTATAQIHNLTAFSLDFAGFQISELTLDDEPAEFFREGEKIYIASEAGLRLDQDFVIRISYAGVPLSQPSVYVPFVNHLGLQFLGSNLYALSQPDGAHFWFPSNDHPLDKAHFRFEIQVPAGLTAVANGVLQQKTSSGTLSTYIWKHDFPMATYLATIAVGEYERIDVTGSSAVPIRHYIFPDLQPQFSQVTAITDEGLIWMSDQFGPYPFETFGFVTTRLIRASLETQTSVLLSEYMLNEETIIHEIIHAWFGDWVSMASWADMWHNEGFAVYLSLAWQTRDDPAGLDFYMNNQAVEILAGSSGLPLNSLPPSQLFATESYWGGAALIHDLRQLIGDEAFFGGLRQYFVEFGGGSASSTDFIHVMEAASGQDLAAFFTEWLE